MAGREDFFWAASMFASYIRPVSRRKSSKEGVYLARFAVAVAGFVWLAIVWKVIEFLWLP